MWTPETQASTNNKWTYIHTYIHTCTHTHIHTPHADMHNNFDDPQDLEGWNCGQITTCGRMGQVCGGFNIKGTKTELSKGFHLLPGTYSVELDFIKIDSWFVCAIE